MATLTCRVCKDRFFMDDSILRHYAHWRPRTCPQHRAVSQAKSRREVGLAYRDLALARKRREASGDHIPSDIVQLPSDFVQISRPRSPLAPGH